VPPRTEANVTDGTFETKKAANAYKDRVADDRVGLVTDTFAGYVGKSWLAAVEPRVDESTFDQYSRPVTGGDDGAEVSSSLAAVSEHRSG